MNNREYLEYEGSRLLEYTLNTFSRDSCGDLPTDIEKIMIKDQDSLSMKTQSQIQDFFWEYLLFRLYITSSIIRDFQDGFGTREPILHGMETMLHAIPDHLNLIALERDLAGSYLLISQRAKTFHFDYVKKRFSAYAAIEQRHIHSANRKEGRDHAINDAIATIAREGHFPMSPNVLQFLQEETIYYIRSLSLRLSKITPEGLHERAHKKTLIHHYGSIFSKETYEHLYPSFTVLASMMVGFLVMFA